MKPAVRSDIEIRSDVEAEIEMNTGLAPTEIGVAVENGVVTLTGTVDSLVGKTEAERAAYRVKGVRAVAEEIEIRLPGDAQRTDAEIGDAAATVLESHSWIPADRIRVRVERGWITLEGEVAHPFEKTMAEDVLRPLLGVKGIMNRIGVKRRKPVVEASIVRDRIEAALRRSAELDAQRIMVETGDGAVVLKGRVQSWAEKQEAERAAWAAPGVSRVDNRIAIAAWEPVDEVC